MSCWRSGVTLCWCRAEPDVYEDNAVEDGAAEEADARLLGLKPKAKKQKKVEERS